MKYAKRGHINEMAVTSTILIIILRQYSCIDMFILWHTKKGEVTAQNMK